MRKGQLKLNSERLAELDVQVKQAAAKSSNSPLLAYNKIRSLIAEKENERVQLRTRMQKLNGEALANRKECSEKEEELEQRKKEKEWQEKTLLQADKEK